jgi:hypothetical protein
LPSFCVWTKSLVCKDAVLQGIPLFRVMSEDSVYKSENLRFPVSRPDDRAIPSGCPSVHCSIRLDDVSYRPDARHTKHHPSGRRTFPSGPSTVSRSFYPACIRPNDSATRPDASQYSTNFRFFPSSNMGRLIQPSGRCGIPSGRASLKVRIAIQISPSGRQSALVWTRVQQLRKLPIRLQPSGRLPIMVRTCA